MKPRKRWPESPLIDEQFSEEQLRKMEIMTAAAKKFKKELEQAGIRWKH